MKARIDHHKTAPAALEVMLQMQKYVDNSGLEPLLLELVKTRASQINACAYCLDMHTKDARALGETEQRLYGLNAWREAPYYTDRERAALAWTESLTLVSESHVPDDVYNEARRHFSEKELVDLTMAVIVINGWNRLNVGFRTVAGNYQSKHKIGN